ncbi:MAG: response regulator transcription factor [Verrucomicrobiota bacterium]
MKRVLLVDDHAIVRKGLKETLEEEIGQITFGEADNAPRVLEHVRQNEWDLVVLDINMEGRSGLDLLTEILSVRPKLPVLVLSMYPVAEFAVRALKQGAAGYLNKQSAPEELVNAVQTLLAGRRYISAELAERLADDLVPDSNLPPHATLSEREYQVMLMIASGKIQKEIAAELSLSAKTVSTYHTRILKKLGLKNDIEVSRYAIQNKLVS